METIFDETFSTPERRRDLLPKWIKIYIWCGMLMSIPILIFSIIRIFNLPEIFKNSFSIGEALGMLFPGLSIFLMFFLVWYELRWAIRLNLFLVVCWASLSIAAVYLNGFSGLKTMALAILIIPYWISLFSIKKRWELEK